MSPVKNGGRWPLVNFGLGIKGRLMEITPTLAKEWLDKNRHLQRNISQAEIDMISRLIDCGDWWLNGSTIVFDNLGRLCDGQHRLAACIKSDRKITSIVLWGIPHEAFPTIDTGRARHARDALKSAGITNQTAMASACQFLYRYENELTIHGAREKELKLSPMEVVRFAIDHKGLDQAVKEGVAAGKIIHNQDVATGCKYIFNRINKKVAAEFYEKIQTGENLEKGSPILLLRNNAIPKRIHIAALAWMTILSWNAYRRKEILNRYDFTPSKPLPKAI